MIGLPEELILKELMVHPYFFLNFTPFDGWKIYMFPKGHKGFVIKFKFM